MYSEPKYCPKCGYPLVDVKDSSDGWSKLVECTNDLPHKYQIVYGDTMGGGPYCEMNER